MVQNMRFSKIRSSLATSGLPEVGAQDGFGWKVIQYHGTYRIQYTVPHETDPDDFNDDCEKLSAALAAAGFKTNLVDLTTVYQDNGLKALSSVWRLSW